MAEASNVRLVRCPKCENLLPELPEYSVYQCGGCGAVLRGTKKEPMSDGLLEKSEDESVRGVYEKGGVSLVTASETERENGDLEHNRTKERVFQERTVNLNSSSSSRTDYKEVLVDPDRNRRGETMGLRSDQSSKVGFYNDDKYRRPSRVPVDNWVWGNDRNSNINNPEFGRFGVANELEEIRHPFGSLRSRPVMDQWGEERNGSGALQENGRLIAEKGRFATFSYPDEGPSNYPVGSFYRYGEQMTNREGLDGLTTVENLENDRAELLRKLDELKDQLSRSCSTAEKPKERVLAGDSRMAPPLANPHGGYESLSECSTNLYNVNMQPPARDKHAPKPPYFNHNHGHVPYAKQHALDMQDFYPPRNVPHEFLGCDGAYGPQMLRRPPHQYLPRRYNDQFPGQYMDFNQDILASHPHETFFHQPACSCLRCYNNNWQIPPKVHPPVFTGQKLRNDPTYPIYYDHVPAVTYGPLGHNSRPSEPPQLTSRDRLPEMRGSTDLDSETGGFGHLRPRRMVVARGKGRVCHPVVGGAPFITCCNCFELLKLPSKLTMMGKNQQKMRCGACSSILLFELGNKGLLVSVTTQIQQISAEVGDGSDAMLKKNLQTSSGFLDAGSTNSCSDDFDNSGYNFQLTDTEPTLLSREPRSVFSEAERRQGPQSSTSSFSEDEQSPDTVIVRRDVTNSAELPSKDNVSLPLPDSPLQENLDYSSFNNVVARYDKGNKSERTDQEKVIGNMTVHTTSRQNSVKDVQVATEMEVHSNEYLKSGVSHDSMEVSKQEDRRKINKGSESFFAGIKKSFKDFSRTSQSMENGRPNVFVNGQPIPDRVVKKAEKISGPIQPGEYWYDFRAGFWGVMGQPCLGIIPPLIEEFNYPMPENCGAGNTGVFVNGRELHQRDLDLLAGRGLPITRDKSYIIEISGRVLDEDTCEELDSLGKLAPTVEKAKHGFGMKVPRVVHNYCE